MFIEFIRSLTVPQWFGILAAGMIFWAQSLEIKAIFVADPATGEKFRPSRSASWLWVVVQTMMVVTYIQTGETWSAGVGIVYAITIFPVAVLSLKYGYLQWRAIDSVCVVGATISVLLWWFSTNLLAVLFFSIVTDFLACTPTIDKAWKDPTSESRMAWAWTTVACLVNFLAVEKWGLESFLYIPYLAGVNGVIAYGVWFSPEAYRARRQRAMTTR